MKDLPPDTDTFRLLDAADHTIDVFASVAIVNLYKSISSTAEAALAQQAVASGKVSAVYLKRRPRQAHDKASQSPQQVAPTKPLFGEAVEKVEAHEAGTKFEIRPANGLSVGLYLDARDARGWVKANARGRTVLNLFAYTCGFGISALLGGATRAVNVDLSRKVLDWGESNTTLNGFVPNRRDFIAGDCFEWLARFAKKGERFDLVVIDPPSFSNTSGQRFRAETDYGPLAALAQKVVSPGGTMLCCCNLETLGAAQFEHQVRQATGIRAKPLTAFGASPVDFAQPSALKVLALPVA